VYKTVVLFHTFYKFDTWYCFRRA